VVILCQRAVDRAGNQGVAVDVAGDGAQAAAQMFFFQSCPELAEGTWA
jgi:hypothetical protein